MDMFCKILLHLHSAWGAGSECLDVGLQAFQIMVCQMAGMFDIEPCTAVIVLDTFLPQNCFS